jgi:Ca2+-binding RTX toxin-like protein
MARFNSFNAGQYWSQSLGNPFKTAAELLYVENGEVGYLCADGTYVFLKGVGFTYVTGADGIPRLSGGKVTEINHFDAAGQFISATTGITGVDGTGALLSSGRFSVLKQDASATVSMLEFNAMAGNDTMDARIRINNAVINDRLSGWGGNDTIYAGSGDDYVSGDEGNDSLYGDAGNDQIAGGKGDDNLYGSTGTDLLTGGSGNDRIDGGSGVDTAFYLGKFSELTITKTAAGFTVASAEGGTDTLLNVERISTNDGVYTFNTTTQNWVKTSGANQSLMLSDTAAVERGGAGADSFASADPNNGATQTSLDLIFGGAGDDSYIFKSSFGLDSVKHDHGLVYAYGGSGNDTLAVEVVTDYILTAPQGTFRLFGEAGNDSLTGGRGNDELDGGIGNDTLNGSNGNDILTGSSGSDLFIFTNVPNGPPRNYVLNSGYDVITDFAVGIDHLQFGSTTTLTLADITAGTLVTAFTPGGPGGITSTVLLQGVHGTIDVSDLLLA